jgi:hypothetical protein
MILGGFRGAELDLGEIPGGLRLDEFLFTETGGFVVEVDGDDVPAFRSVCGSFDVDPQEIGRTLRGRDLQVSVGREEKVSLDGGRFEERWRSALRERLR